MWLRLQITRFGAAISFICILLAFHSNAREADVTPPVHTVVAPDTLFKEIRSELMQMVGNGELPSAAVGVINQENILWVEVIGWADKENNIPATATTHYGLASVGKSITATGVMVLVEQGKIDLNHSVESYIAPATLTAYEGTASDVTVRRLLNMTAAIPHGNLDYLSREDARSCHGSDIVKNRGIIVFPPGEIYLYSNFTYGVLEHLIECISGIEFSHFLTEKVFTPLGMEHAFVGGSSESTGLLAARYGIDGTRLTATYPIPRNSRAIHASINDLIRYAQFHLQLLSTGQQQILSEDLLDRMHYEKPDLDQSIMALGWGSIDLGDSLYWLLTNGRDDGAQATVSLIPGNKLAVICLTNKTGNVTDEVAFRVTDLLIPGFLNHVMQRISEYEAWANRPFQPDEDLVGDWEGSVRTPKRDLDVSISFNDKGEIRVNLEGQGENLLSDVRLREGLISGNFVGFIPFEETSESPQEINLAIKFENNRLFGYATAVFSNEKGHYSLPAYVSLLPKSANGVKY
jgi:CubicO group peptidase (beta-lactamase class C family)